MAPAGHTWQQMVTPGNSWSQLEPAGHIFYYGTGTSKIEDFENWLEKEEKEKNDLLTCVPSPQVKNVGPGLREIFTAARGSQNTGSYNLAPSHVLHCRGKVLSCNGETFSDS